MEVDENFNREAIEPYLKKGSIFDMYGEFYVNFASSDKESLFDEMSAYAKKIAKRQRRMCFESDDGTPLRMLFFAKENRMNYLVQFPESVSSGRFNEMLSAALLATGNVSTAMGDVGFTHGEESAAPQGLEQQYLEERCLSGDFGVLLEEATSFAHQDKKVVFVPFDAGNPIVVVCKGIRVTLEAIG